MAECEGCGTKAAPTREWRVQSGPAVKIATGGILHPMRYLCPACYADLDDDGKKGWPTSVADTVTRAKGRGPRGK
jgi:hypothetical protein